MTEMIRPILQSPLRICYDSTDFPTKEVSHLSKEAYMSVSWGKRTTKQVLRFNSCKMLINDSILGERHEMPGIMR